MANQASDGKAPASPGYQIGELDLGPQPKRSASQEVPAVVATGPQPAQRQSGSGVQPMQRNAPAGTVQGYALADAAAQANLAAQQAATQAQARPSPAPGAAQQPAQAAQALTPAQMAQLQAERAARLQAAEAAQAATRAQAVQAQAAQAQAPAKPAAAAKVAGGGQLAAFEESAEAPALELDFARVPAKGGKIGAAKLPAPPPPANDVGSQMGFGESNGEGFGGDEGGPALELAEVGARVDSVKGGTRDAKAATNKETDNVDALAKFDPVPETLTDCVKYAIHVTRRLGALRKERAKAEQDAAGLEADLNTAFVEVGQGLMAMQTDPALSPLRSRIAAVLDAQSRVSDADLTMTKTREQNQQAVAALDREAAELRQNVQPFMAAEQAAEQAHKKAEDEVKRATALQRRVEIELRALNDATSIQDPVRSEDLRAQLDERRSTVAGLTVEMERMASLLGQARRELALKKGVLDSIEDRKKRLIDEFQKKEADVEQKAKAAEGGHADAMRSLAETAREQGIAQQIVPDKLAWVEEVEGVLADAHKVVYRYDRALKAYDQASVKKGWMVMGGGAFALLVVIVGLVMGS